MGAKVQADHASLRARLAALLGFVTPLPRPELAVSSEYVRDGYIEQEVSYTGGEGAVPALLLIPAAPTGGGVVCHHQHGGQWHLGKSEVAGHGGSPWQAFGPALARRGVTVLAFDAVGFEDRRLSGPGSDARASDERDYVKEMTYRVVQGRSVMSTVLADAAAAHGALGALDWVDDTRVGAVGHSMGGASALFHAALDERVAFAAISGASNTYRDKMRRGIEIDSAQAVPGLLTVVDTDAVTALVAPRPLLLCSADQDRYTLDAEGIADTAARAYQQLGAPAAIRHIRAHGGHNLDAERFEAIVEWVADATTAA